MNSIRATTKKNPVARDDGVELVARGDVLHKVNLPSPGAEDVRQRTSGARRLLAPLPSWHLSAAKSSFQVVVYNGSQTERQIGDIMRGGNHAADWQPRDITHCVLEELNRSGS